MKNIKKVNFINKKFFTKCRIIFYLFFYNKLFKTKIIIIIYFNNIYNINKKNKKIYIFFYKKRLFYNKYIINIYKKIKLIFI